MDEQGADYPRRRHGRSLCSNITIDLVVALKKITEKTLDVHLMIVEPEKFVEDFAKAGADIITVRGNPLIFLVPSQNSFSRP